MKRLFLLSLVAILACYCPNNAKAQEQSDDAIHSFTSLQNPPTYPGGIKSFYDFIGGEMKYPTTAVKENVQGNVLISFIVEKDGSLNNINVERKLGAGTDEEAVRVLKLSKKWNPGMMNGKPVRVKYNIPIKFAIPNKKSNDVAPVGATTTNDETIYNFVSMENPPKYAGGMAAFYAFISQNLKYPEKAIKEKIEGSVLVSFTIEKDGSLNDINIVRKLGAGLDEEAVRVLNLSEKWDPGKLKDGTVVRVKYNIPIKFSLAKKN